jgi:hypothetical protein
MPERAGRKADVVREFVVRRQLREPVDRLGIHERFNAAALSAYPIQLRVTGAAGELLGVEIQPGPVGPVEVAAASLWIVGLTSGGRYECEPTRSRKVSAREFDESQRRPVRADTVEEVITARVVRNAPCGAAFDRRSLDVAVVRGQIDQAAPGVKDVVVVDRRQVIDWNPLELGLGP